MLKLYSYYFKFILTWIWSKLSKIILTSVNSWLISCLGLFIISFFLSLYIFFLFFFLAYFKDIKFILF